MKHVIVVAPLGRGYNQDETEICVDCKLRCRTALYEAWELRRSSNVEVVLACGPGRERRRITGPTMAVMMCDYLTRAQPELPILVNRHSPKVWGTLQEMRWIITTTQKTYGYDFSFVFVSAKRHDKRILYILRHFFPEVNARVVTSHDAVIPLYHEWILGYPKLVAARLGFEDMVEKIRYATAFPSRKG